MKTLLLAGAFAAILCGISEAAITIVPNASYTCLVYKSSVTQTEIDNFKASGYFGRKDNQRNTRWFNVNATFWMIEGTPINTTQANYLQVRVDSGKVKVIQYMPNGSNGWIIVDDILKYLNWNYSIAAPE